MHYHKDRKDRVDGCFGRYPGVGVLQALGCF